MDLVVIYSIIKIILTLQGRGKNSQDESLIQLYLLCECILPRTVNNIIIIQSHFVFNEPGFSSCHVAHTIKCHNMINE